MIAKVLIPLLLSATCVLAQFRSPSGIPFTYKTQLQSNDVFIVGTPGVANYNVTWGSFASNSVYLFTDVANNLFQTSSPPNYIYVSAARGRTVGQRGNPARPFLSVNAAISNAQPGDIVIVNDGLFVEQIWMKPEVNLFLNGIAGVSIPFGTCLVFTNAGNYTVSGSGYIEGAIALASGVNLTVSFNHLTNNVLFTSYNDSVLNNINISLIGDKLTFGALGFPATSSGRLNVNVKNIGCYQMLHHNDSIIVRVNFADSFYVNFFGIAGTNYIAHSKLLVTNAPAFSSYLILNNVCVTNDVFSTSPRVTGTYYVSSY